MATRFDPIDYLQQLEAAGVSRAGAEVHAKTLVHLVSDCIVLPVDLTELEHNLMHEIKALEMRLELMIRESEQRLDARITALQADMRFMRWMNGMTMAL